MTIQPVHRPIAQDLVAAVDTLLINAVKSGDLEKVGPLLRTENVNAKDEDGWTALMHAAFEGDEPMLRLFLVEKPQIDLNATNNAGETALMLAAEGRCVGAMKFLLSVGADVNIVDDSSSTALLMYLNSLHGEDIDVDLVQDFLRENLDISAKDWRGNNALMLASKTAGPALKDILLLAMINHPGIINDRNEKGYTALCFAAERGDAVFAKKLVAAGADVAWVTKDGKTAADLAIEAMDVDLADFLLMSAVEQGRESLEAAKILRQNALSQWAELNGPPDLAGVDDLDEVSDTSRKGVSFNEEVDVREFEPADHEKDDSERGLDDR
ncbi:ankyrin repeat domain-containing protein [Pantoea sp. 18069]|uniref:ankyrin repeat domain-containing protein n=1 Tax=Pantoea sp. 18069 TaxID=2681415 RepID=UPI00135A3451|nr:ankyrin repeat domain-containing protein [Pantoea sp. 18069]